MRNIRLTVAYDGTSYCGWQIQPNVPTVQGAIEAALLQILQKPHRLRSAGRTDAGVHAIGQVANFTTDCPLQLRQLQGGLNALTPDDITITQVVDVALDFDIRRQNHGKHYRYTIANSWELPPPLLRTAFHVRRPLDLAAMASAAWQLVGTHDFAAFRAADCDRESTRRTLFRCTVSTQASLVTIDVEGTAFLKQMVRVIAGTLVEIGQGRFAPTIMSRLLASGDRSEAGGTAPAHGLCLVQVFV